MRISFFHIVFLFAAFSARAKDVNIKKYGAVGDGKTLNTAAIQKAIDACYKSGGGNVIFPAGNFLSGTIELKDNVTIYLEKNARLLGSTDIEQYRNLDPFTEGLGIDVGWALLVAVDKKNIGICGEGAIDGQGSKLKAEHILKDTRPEGQRWGRRPFLLRIVRCNGVTVKDVTLNYAAAWTSHYGQSKNIRIENVKIVSVGVAHNDGIGIDGCQHVRIKNCDVISGDDALVFKTTSSKMACRDIEVTGMRLKSNQAGIKMGTESMANFENITITGCHIYDTRNGGIKLLTVDGAHLRNVTISDITMDEVRTPMLFRLGSRLKVFRKGDVQQPTGSFENVTIRNVQAKAADSAQLKPPSGILITGVPGHYITGLTLENIDITLAGGGTAGDAKVKVPEAIDQYPEVKTFGPAIPAYGLWARHVRRLKLKNVRFHLKSADQRPEFFFEDATTDTATSEWVYANAKGKLEYKTLPAGDRIMDFSYAGYMGGGVRIPDVAEKISLRPGPGDNSGAIQQAIDEVSKLKPVNGFRGAVVLQPGSYDCEKTINIDADGVVLRGNGSATVLNLTGKPHACIMVRGRVATKVIGDSTIIADRYVAAGSFSFSVENAGHFSTGDTIRITRRITPEWIEFMGMDKLVRDGKKQTWVSGVIETERVIRAIEQNKITVDVPLNDSYDSKYTGPVSVQKISSTGMLHQIGIENFKIVSPAQSVTISEGHHRAFIFSGLSDGWARYLEIFNTVNSVSVTGRRITVDNIRIVHDVPTIGAAKPADLNGSGYQILFNRCYIKGDNLFFFGTGAKVTGPIVVLNSVFEGNGWIQPHQRWATGLLIDRCEVPGGGIDFMNRGSMGSGHGWAIGWAVAWNCMAKSYLNQMPPGAANWVIGSQGEHQLRAIPFNSLPYLPEGIYDSPGRPVTPSSLYLAQLAERLGKQALVNIGYNYPL